MRRSGSAKGKDFFHPSQCVPSGLGGGKIVMPSGGGLVGGVGVGGPSHNQAQQSKASNSSNGYISPQYGWYISMTPPTPPHYHNHTHGNGHGHGNDAANGANSNNTNRKTTSEPQQIIHEHQPFQVHGNQQLYHQQQTTHMHNGNVAPDGRPMMMPHSRPVFTRNLKGIPNNTSGWPSVPL